MKDLFCGNADGYPAADFKPKSIPWNSGQLIGHLDENNFKLSEVVIELNKATFWKALPTCGISDRASDAEARRVRNFQ